MKRTFTRQELYDLVWSTPIQKLAEQFGLSDRGLAKTCQRHQVPVPGRGYWAKLEAGQPANKTPLAKLNNPGLEPVHIGAFKREVNPYVAYALEQAKTRQSTKAPIERALPREVVVAPPIAEPPKTEPSPSPQTFRTHRSLEGLAKELQSRKPDYDGYIDVRWIRIPPSSIGRVVEFLDRLATELEPDGIEFSAAGSRVKFHQGPTEVDFQITSPRKQVMNETKYSWKQREYVHTGRLSLRIFAQGEGVKKNWIDKDEKLVEESVPQIAESFRLLLVAQKAEDDVRRAEEQRRAELARRRDLAKKRVEREDARLKFLAGIADARREAEDLRRTIDLVPEGDLDAQPDLALMLQWARRRLVMLDENTLPQAIQSRLVEHNLFADPDDLYDPEGEPPPQKGYWD